MTDIFTARTARPMLIGRITQPFDDPDCLFELKLDGERCLAYLDKHEAVLVNRRGFKLSYRVPELANIHKQANARCILDGELITGLGRKEDFDGVKGRLAHQSKAKIRLGMRQFPISFVVFDILYHTSKQVTALPLEERKHLLAATVAESEHMTLSRTVEGQGKAFYELVLAQGLEGIVSKQKSSLYYPGKRTKAWAKIKNLEEDDYIICGYIPAEHVAMLILGQYEGSGRLVYKGRVTLGLRTEDFAQVEKVPRTERSPFAQPFPEEDTAIWLRPQLVCTVYFMHRLEGGLMRQPHFRRLRPDKAPTEAVAPSL